MPTATPATVSSAPDATPSSEPDPVNIRALFTSGETFPVSKVVGDMYAEITSAAAGRSPLISLTIASAIIMRVKANC